eukprot:m.34939 g.34939  ORF g.34939 m.34939 type:complete len:419 (-) comp17058_c0_seq4:103-1359(-)
MKRGQKILSTATSTDDNARMRAPHPILKSESVPPADMNGFSDVDENGVDYSRQPPPIDGNALLRVDYRCGASRLTEVSTQTETAYVKAFLALYWTDVRLIDWKGPLPEDLWGPFCNLRNGIAYEMEIDDHEFLLVDAKVGRLKRFIIFEGRVVNNLDLLEFPFDVNTIDVEFGFISHWRTKDHSKSGTSAGARTYDLQEVRSKSEGDVIGIFWDGHIAEWTLHGASVILNEHNDVSGYEHRMVKLQFHVGRNIWYYAVKIMLPLYLLIVNFGSDFVLPVDDLSSRSANTMTGFLASFAFLYFISESLPKVDFLTRIDKIVVWSLITMTLCGVEAWVCYLIDIVYGRDTALMFNWISVVVLAAVYIMVNVVLLVPGHRRKQRKLASLQKAIQAQPKTFDDIEGPRKAFHIGFTYKPKHA